MRTDVGKVTEKEEHFSTVVGLQTNTTTLEISLVIPQKIGPEDPAIPLLGIYPRDTLIHNKDICTTMFIAALFIISRSWKEPRCPPVDEWIKKSGIFTQWSTTQLSEAMTL